MSDVSRRPAVNASRAAARSSAPAGIRELARRGHRAAEGPARRLERLGRDVGRSAPRGSRCGRRPCRCCRGSRSRARRRARRSSRRCPTAAPARSGGAAPMIDVGREREHRREAQREERRSPPRRPRARRRRRPGDQDAKPDRGERQAAGHDRGRARSAARSAGASIEPTMKPRDHGQRPEPGLRAARARARAAGTAR